MDYYKTTYSELYYKKGLSHWATRLIHVALERHFKSNKDFRILEIGGGEGFHTEYVVDDFCKYVLTDIKPRKLSLVAQKLANNGKLEVRKCKAESLSLGNNEFDRVIFMCVLHHLEGIRESLDEARRVTKSGGWVSIYLPCDPGALYRFTRFIFLFARLRDLNLNFQVMNAFEHRNHFKSLISIIKEMFKDDEIKLMYFPLPFPTWNFNLYAVIHIRVEKHNPSSH